jgi:hypothetical protein
VASLGNGSNVGGGHIPANTRGSTTNAISADGSKVFFELPAEEQSIAPLEPPHLYMRDLSSGTTTPLDDPASAGTAQYEGASKDGSLVFFTSDEGLDGASTNKEIYEFNTTSTQIGEAPPMSAVPISSGGVVGLTAISNDGSHVFFIADPVLASNTNSSGSSAVAGEPNMYVYDTRSGETTFIATLSEGDVSGIGLVDLVTQPDIYRSAYPTPDGSALMFISTGDLTGQDPAPETTLSSTLNEGERNLVVASTAGFLPHQYIQIGTGSTAQREKIESVDGPTELTLAEPQEWPYVIATHQAGETVTQPNSQVYRFDVAGNSLICVSCTPPGTPATGNAAAGASVGGSYAPLGISAQGGVPLSADGSRLFFESPDALLPGVRSGNPENEVRRLYEWENGKLALISGSSSGTAILNGTTPSGNDVFFASRTPLTGAENLGMWMVYDARVGGGFPMVSKGSSCVGEDCRSATESPVSFAIPASALLGAGPSNPLPSVGKPRLVVANISAAQRRALARTGHITLTASGSAAGRIVGSVFAKVKGKLRRVGGSSTALKRAGNVTLTLKLSSLARGVLAKRGSLTVRLEVGYSASGIPDVAEFKLVKGKSATAKRRSHA